MQQCTPEVLASPDVKLAMKLHQALQSGHWLPYFRQLLSAPYLAACLGNMYCPALRCAALQALLKGQGRSLQGCRAGARQLAQGWGLPIERLVPCLLPCHLPGQSVQPRAGAGKLPIQYRLDIHAYRCMHVCSSYQLCPAQDFAMQMLLLIHEPLAAKKERSHAHPAQPFVSCTHTEPPRPCHAPVVGRQSDTSLTCMRLAYATYTHDRASQPSSGPR